MVETNNKQEVETLISNRDWVELPQTQELLTHLRDSVEKYKQQWSDGAFIDANKQNYAQRASGFCAAYENLIIQIENFKNTKRED